MIGPIQGVVNTVAQLPTDGISQGDIYYVQNDPNPENNGLYFWDATNGWTAIDVLQGPRGDTGETGPQGDAATSYTIIPFASQAAPNVSTSGGRSTNVALLGFGYGDERVGANYTVSTDSSDGHFSLGDNANFQVVFSLPFDMKIESIALTAGNWEAFNRTVSVTPYVQLYSAAPASNTFMPIPGAIARTDGYAAGSHLTATMLPALAQNLDIGLTAGTRIAIGGLVETGATTGDDSFWLYFTGAVGMTRWVR